MPDDDLFNGWKEIAKYLKVTPKTAQRWEGSDQLPVMRPQGRAKGPVLARRSSLDAWLQGSLHRVAFEGNFLIGIGRSGRILWRYDCATRLHPFKSEELEWRIQLADLFGNGDHGVLLTASFVDLAQPDRMYYLSSEGKLEWAFEAESELLDRNKVAFEKAWAFKHVLLTLGSGGPKTWVALANHAGWAGCVLRLDSHGIPTVKLANAGYVERLCYSESKGSNYLVVCGENNAFDQAFVALLGADDPPCVSPPGGRPRYQYANPPTGSPRKYILFPRTELIAARQKPYGHASKIRLYSDDLIVEVETGGEGGCFLYHFTPELRPKYVFPSGSHEFWHRELEHAGQIEHAWSACPELDYPLVLDIWDPSLGWHHEEIRWRDNPWEEK